jgi:hypothetical protein
MRKSFVIYDFVGSVDNPVTQNINDYFKINVKITRDPDYVPDHEDYTCIIIQRKIDLQSICDFFKYEKNGTIDPRDFRLFYREFSNFYNRIDLSHYKKVIKIDYDQFVTDPYYLFDLFNIVEQTDYKNIKPTIDHSKKIKNYDELATIYNYLDTGAYDNLPKYFVIYSPMRTGSTIIARNIENFLASVSNEYQVVHTHDPKVRPPDGNYTCIVSHRTDIFNSICSLLTSTKTTELVSYTNKPLEKFYVEPNEFIKTFMNMNSFYTEIDRSKFKNIISVDFDLLISDPYYLFGQLGIKERTNYDLIEKSPYKYRELIINFSEIEELYNNIVKISTNYNLPNKK